MEFVSKSMCFVTIIRIIEFPISVYSMKTTHKKIPIVFAFAYHLPYIDYLIWKECVYIINFVVTSRFVALRMHRKDKIYKKKDL